MEHERDLLSDIRLQKAVGELRDMIVKRYPEATFTVSRGEDPEGVYLTPTVDVEDTEEVFDVVVDRLLEMQIDSQLPIYVVPIRPVERVLAEMEAQTHSGRHSRGRVLAEHMAPIISR